LGEKLSLFASSPPIWVSFREIAYSISMIALGAPSRFGFLGIFFRTPQMAISGDSLFPTSRGLRLLAGRWRCQTLHGIVPLPPDFPPPFGLSRDGVRIFSSAGVMFYADQRATPSTSSLYKEEPPQTPQIVTAGPTSFLLCPPLLSVTGFGMC